MTTILPFFKNEFDSLHEQVRLGSRNLQLVDKIGHEPVRVGLSVEVVMINTLNIDPSRLAADSRDVLKSSRMGTSVVICGCEHGDGHVLNVF